MDKPLSSDEARELFEPERKEQRKLTRAIEEFTPAYAAHLGTHPGMLAEIALTFHIFSGQYPTPEISAETMAFAIRYMGRVRKHSCFLYSSILSATPPFELAQSLASEGEQWRARCAAVIDLIGDSD